ncbi:MAG: NADH-quinone oxidoreductase subunit F, partial [Planctomycetota bacterium]
AATASGISGAAGISAAGAAAGAAGLSNPSVSPAWALSELSHAGIYSSIVFILVSIGFLIKTASFGLHIWAPGAYAESEDDVSPLISAVLSKAGILGFLALFLYMGLNNPPHIGSLSLSAVIGWIGVLTALFATIFAVFQEDAKKLLAYSSVGQVGYIVLAAAMMSHLGWVAALWHSVLHLLFKGLLFLAIAGVVYRTGTRNMYRMGGLIKRMPFSFVSVLIGIIALAGVPPLAGFGSKWLIYEALIEKGWYLQAAVAFFASTIAFLYCYRLIHSIFLGMPKPRYKNIKEAPAWLLIPQYILVLTIFGLSAFPLTLLKRLSAIVSPIIPATLNWHGFTAVSSLGYWNGTAVMIVVMAIFIIMLLYLLLFTAKPQKVKPFNIVYAAERPESPETTHYAYNFFTPYGRAMGPILKPLAKRFWSAVSEWSHSIAASVRHIYTGDGQTYALYIFIVGVLIYFISAGGR